MTPAKHKQSRAADGRWLAWFCRCVVRFFSAFFAAGSAVKTRRALAGHCWRSPGATRVLGQRTGLSVAGCLLRIVPAQHRSSQQVCGRPRGRGVTFLTALSRSNCDAMRSEVAVRKAQACAMVLFVAGVLCGASLCAQDGKPVATTRADEDVVKAPRNDPFTDGDEARMRAAGIIRYAPFPWADHITTADIERVLGEGRVRWLETAHFRIGLNLKTALLPVEQLERRQVADELALLQRKLPRVVDKPKKLDPWLLLHLFAQRAESAYAEFQQVVGVTDATFPGGKESPNGKYLGLPDKFLLLLFQKRSDLARYTERFTTQKSDTSLRYYHPVTQQFLFAVAMDSLEEGDAQGLHSNVLYSLFHNFLGAFYGYNSALPPWLAEGLAHYYSRRVRTNFINCVTKASESVNNSDKHEWAKKIRLRAQHDGATIPFEQMLAWVPAEDLGYQGHIQSWSRVDYLLSMGPEKLGLLVTKLKTAPVPQDGSGIEPSLAKQLQIKALADLWHLDPAQFDASWRKWTQKEYAKQ